MTTEETLEAIESFVDYTLQLNRIETQINELSEYSASLPQIYNTLVLILGTIITMVVFRFLVTFIGRIFNDTTQI